MENELIFQDTDNRFRVVFCRGPIETMFDLCVGSKGREIGGILIGVYSPDLKTAQVKEATTPPPDSMWGWNWFSRGKQGLGRLLKARWKTKPRTYYLGEWHFHPENAPEASRQDIEQMRLVASNPAYQCDRPLLGIVYQRSVDDFGVSLFVVPEGEDAVKLFQTSKLPSTLPKVVG